MMCLWRGPGLLRGGVKVPDLDASAPALTGASALFGVRLPLVFVECGLSDRGLFPPNEPLELPFFSVDLGELSPMAPARMDRTESVR
jgi:hypothetical protein